LPIGKVSILLRSCMTKSDSPILALETAPHRFVERVSFGYFAMAMSHGVMLSFFPQWLAAQGYSAALVGVILSAQLACRTLTVPVISSLADNAKERVYVGLGLAIITLVLSFGYWLPQTFWLTMLVSLLIVPSWGGLSPLLDSFALSGQRRYNADYARMRVWASISFLSAGIVTGYATGAFGIEIVPWLATGCFAIMFGSQFLLPRLGPVRNKQGKMDLGFVGASIALKRYAPMALASGLIIGSHGYFYAFASIHYASIGHSQGEIGLLWAFSVVCEVVLFWFSKRFIKIFAPETLITIGGAGAIVRWLLMPFAQNFTPSPLLADFALQALHALTFALTYLATQRAVAERFKDSETGKALGLTFFMSGIVFSVTTLISGPLFQRFAIKGIFAMAGFALIGLLIVAFTSLRAEAIQPYIDL
jgi:MFS transporter, PPP family, 3-phenylpropionic acid transporter